MNQVTSYAAALDAAFKGQAVRARSIWDLTHRYRTGRRGTSSGYGPPMPRQCPSWEISTAGIVPIIPSLPIGGGVWEGFVARPSALRLL